MSLNVPTKHFHYGFPNFIISPFKKVEVIKGFVVSNGRNVLKGTTQIVCLKIYVS